MGNEYPLKVMVVGLENLAVDNEKLCEYLNLRARYYGFDDSFKGADYEPPMPPYPSKRASQTKAARLVSKIVINNTYAVISLGATPATAAPLDPKIHNEADLLRLLIDWGILQSAAYKAMLRLYGLIPTASPELISPGAASESRLWAEIVAWLEKIAADTDLYDMVQHINPQKPPKPAAAKPGMPPLIEMELGTHRVTLDLLTIASLLPYHLYHASRASGPPRE